MEAYIEHFGYLAIFFGTLLEGETVLVLGGFAAHRGYLQLPLVMLAAMAGTVAGDQLFFYLGRRHSQTLLRRRPHWQAKLAKVEKMVASHRLLIILGFRFLYGLRTITPFALGASSVPARIFVPLNILGGVAWAVIIGGAGYLFGQGLENLFSHLKEIEFLVMGGIALAGAGVWLGHYRAVRGTRKH